MIWVDVTPRAARRVRALLTRKERTGRYGLRVALAADRPGGAGGAGGSGGSGGSGSSGGSGEYVLSLAPTPHPDELVLPRHGFDVFVSTADSDQLDGVRVDYVESDAGSGFLVDRPARLQGACSGCGAAPSTLTQLIETTVAAGVPEVSRTVLVA